MQNEQDIRELKEELEKLTGFIGENGSDEQLANKIMVGACWVSDTLGWILKEIQTLHFKSTSHIDIKRLRQIAIAIEIRTGKKLGDYK